MIKELAKKLGIGRASAALAATKARMGDLAGKLRLAVRARYDAAQTTHENREHWKWADDLSARASLSPEVRHQLRRRSRYEIANNSYAHGMALTLANDCVGTGPRLHLSGASKADSDQVERLFAEWATEIDLAGRLTTARLAKIGDGEAFALLTTNPTLRSQVKLDVRLIEAEQVAPPYSQMLPDGDGIVVDPYGNPSAYQVLKQHPGDLRVTALFAYDTLPARSVLHYFNRLRPGQTRGVPEITPALPLFAQLRRYTLATLTAAESAADFAIVVQSDGPANSDESSKPLCSEGDTFDLERGMATVLPEGWKLGQVKPEHPSTTYPEFKNHLLNEIGRCLNMPFNVVACNSSAYNYASGRLDHQVYGRALNVERARIVRVLLDPIFDAWLGEATLIEGYLPQSFRRTARAPRQWFWDGADHVDPMKEAAAQELRLKNNTSTLNEEYGRRGRDWNVELEQAALERKRMLELGLVPAGSMPAAAGAIQQEQSDDAA